MKVRFSDPDEFLGELERDARSGAVEGKILRVTKRYTPSEHNLNLTHLSVIATYVARSQVVTLERYMGLLWGKGFEEQDRPILEGAQRLQERIESLARRLGLEVRAGVILPS